MRSKIGLIGTATLFPSILRAADGLDCDITPLEYERMAELPGIYQAHHDQFDGFVVTGNIAKEVILRGRGDDDKPLHSISGLSVEYYQEFFRLIRENRSIDFSRVMLDSGLWVPGRGPQSVEEFLQRRLAVEKKQVKLARSLSMEPLERAEQIIWDNARRCLDRGELDLVVCRFSTAYQVLRQAGIPCSFVYPDPDNIVDTLTLLLQDIKLEHLSGGLPAVILLSAPTIQRIASVSQLLGSAELTTQELASAMQVTVANANRFLNALVKSGQAHIATEKRSASKGRPRRVYHLDFLDQKGERQ